VILGSSRGNHLLPGLSVDNSSIDLPQNIPEIDGFPAIRIATSDLCSPLNGTDRELKKSVGVDRALCRRIETIDNEARATPARPNGAGSTDFSNTLRKDISMKSVFLRSNPCTIQNDIQDEEELWRGNTP
jgi:hypothetical protein